MPYEKTIVCLAGSWRKGGRCFAGRGYEDEQFGDWIRPVSHRPSMEINDSERRTDNARYADVLDVVTISFDSPVPNSHQTENHLIAQGAQWRHQTRLRYEDVLSAVDDKEPQDLWGLGFESTGHKNNKVKAKQVSGFDCSLLLVKVVDLQLTVDWHPNRWGHRYRGTFMFEGHEYTLSVTDVWIAERYTRNGSYTMHNVILCLSLGDRYVKGDCYKLIAAIITPERN